MASPPPYTIGTVTLVNGSAAIVGTGTGWQINGVRGGIMTVEAVGNAMTIAAVTDDTHATAATKWTGPDGTYAYAISMASADAADTIWASRHWSRVVGQALLAGIVPVASGTLAERDALDPQPATGEWFAHAEPPNDLTFWRKVPDGWEGPFEFRGEGGPAGAMGTGLVPVGAWSNAANYARGSYVHHGGRTFVSLLNANTGNEPPAANEDSTAWMWIPAPQGATGPTGFGWAAVFAVVNDGARRVQQVMDWFGGTGPKPPAGMFVGPGGWVETAAEAVDVRGLPGSGDGDVIGPSGGVTNGQLAAFDGATGKVIKGYAIIPASNANNATSNSFCRWDGTEGTAAAANYPTLGGASEAPRGYNLITHGTPDGSFARIMQIATEIFGAGTVKGRTFIRVKHDTIWTGWYEVANAASFLPLAGGTMSGRLRIEAGVHHPLYISAVGAAAAAYNGMLGRVETTGDGSQMGPWFGWHKAGAAIWAAGIGGDNHFDIYNGRHEGAPGAHRFSFANDGKIWSSAWGWLDAYFASNTTLSGKAGFYAGSAVDETNLPIGAVIAVFRSTATPDRNAVVTPALATGSGSYTIDYNVGALLSGTWRARGLVYHNASGSQGCILQRTA